MHHEVSFLYSAINALLNTLLGPPPSGKVLFTVGSFQFKFPHEWMPDPAINALLVVLVLLTIGLLLRRGLSKDRPGQLQQIFEVVVGGIRGLMHDVIGHHADSYLGMIGTFAFFICLCNAFGLIFFLQPPTANLNTNLALALVSFTYYHVQGIKHSGFSYFKHFCGPIALLAFFFIPLEIVSHSARVISLTLRLTGNITGEHTATGVFAEIFPILIPWPMMLLGIVGTFMQTFIFVMLSSVYVSEAVAEEH